MEFMECIAGCGNTVPFHGYCFDCQWLADGYQAAEQALAPRQDAVSVEERRHTFFQSLPRTDAGVETIGERRMRMTKHVVTVVLSSAYWVALCVASVEGAAEIFRRFYLR